MSNCTSCNVIDEEKEVPCPDVVEDTQVGDCPVDEDGNIIVDANEDPSQTGCIMTPYGLQCPSNQLCDYWQLSESPEACIMEDFILETITIGGAPVVVHKLLGVHEQGKLHDLVGMGQSISSGSLPNFLDMNAFDKFNTEWRSLQIGPDVQKSAFIGYDFGPIRLDNGRERYGTETYVKHDVIRVRFMQGCESKNRATRVRLERSDDGKKWYGVQAVNVPDCDGLVTLDFKKSVPSRWWRVRPIEFNGGEDDYWAVKALQLIDYEKTRVNNIQDRFLLENRDRDYTGEPINMKVSYIPIDVQGDNAKHGMFFGQDNYILETSFKDTLARLGRPFVVGDIIELKPETQYTPTLQAVKKYVEVTDVAWSTNGYTPTWVPTMQRLICKPALATQETQDIFGKLTGDFIDNGDLFDNDDGNAEKYQDYSNISKTIKAEANTRVPQDGVDYAEKPELSDEMVEAADKIPGLNITKLGRQRHKLGHDALPPNGLPFTEGDEFPQKPKDGDYHRLTYVKIRNGIPARLYRYSELKSRWIYLETDHRTAIMNAKSMIEQFKDPTKSSATPPSEVDKELKRKL